MLGTIISTIVLGTIIGALARLILPGKQNIGMIMTILLGAAGSFLGTWVSYKLIYPDQTSGWQLIPFLIGTVIAVILIAIYTGITGRRGAAVRR